MSVVRASLAASLPEYDLGGELGRGGWGVVRDGRRRAIGSAVAIKELPQAYAADRAVRNRFVQEAERLVAFDHPNVVAVVDFVATDGVCALVMEQIRGGSVWGDFVVNGMTARRACAVVADAASGVQAAHLHGVLHRDLKPENLLYGDDGRVRVADFGLARIVAGHDTVATTDGEVLGTPAYLAPEQVLGQGVGPATDVYALGAILYELLCGELPHLDDGTPLTTLRRHVDEQPTPLGERAPAVPPAVQAVVMRAIARHQDERPQTAEELRAAIEAAARSAWGEGWRDVHDPTEVAVRPQVIGHPVGGTATSIPPDRQLPLRTLTVLPRSPARPFAVAAAAVLVTLLVALLGLGSPSREGGVVVVGVEPRSIDFAQPVTLEAEAPPGRLAAVVTIGRLDVARVVADSSAAGAGRRRATFDLSHVRYLVAGRSTLTVTTADRAIDARVGSIEIDSSRSGWLSAPAIGSLIVGLTALAYGESMLAPARRGRVRIHHLAGLAVAAAVLGVALYSIGWVIGAPEPRTTGAVVCAIAMAVAAVGYAVGRSRFTRRRQARRAERRRAEQEAAARRAQAAADQLAAREAAT